MRHVHGLLLTRILSRNWVVLLLRGIVAIVFGVLAGMQSGVNKTLLSIFGAYVLVDGTLGVGIALGERTGHEYWWVLLFWGLVGVAVALMSFLVQGPNALILLFYVAIWAIATGICEVVIAVRLRREMEGEWLFILGGLLSVVFGGALMAQPHVGAAALLWLIAAYAVVFGIFLIIMALRARGFDT